MSTESWPPPLKEWVATCLGQMTDANRAEAQDELRKVISDAFNSQTLWTTDWKGVQLQSLLPKALPTSNSLKRKFTDGTPNGKKSKKSQISKSATSNALDVNDQAALNRRAERFRREHEIEQQKMRGGQTSLKTNPKSAHLYMTSRSGSPSVNTDDPEADPNVPNWDRHTIVGTSREIFKDYLRLTSEPKPEQIRPYPILQQTLIELKKRWREKVDYDWIRNQLKSVRQDLTVQRIKNDFTVLVYEIHARIALEASDLVEYNACQAMLRTLYELGIPGKVEEFTAYRILMLIHGRNRSELNLYVGQLTRKQKENNAVKHALGVQRALALGNYHKLFQLYVTAPNMGAYIMDHFIERERIRALLTISKSYHKIALSFVTDELAFDAATDARDFLVKHGAAQFSNPASPDGDKVFDCKQALPALSQAFEEMFRKVQIKGAV
ncbi:SAC3/GANP/Nin1/mts3/eIF-3 p25 family-domain-containing protein [Amylostereum chailletii]|nr:SAC3/GANP/Nin1/mts3/eIF-3 p25 family-domain-containing protein [Amylostereum chailletii]